MPSQKSSKELIVERLDTYLKNKSQEYSHLPYGTDIYDKLFPYATHGKCIRGKLLLDSARVFFGNSDEKLVDLACAVELLHSAFLIQDDIMDNDEKRRGMQAMHVQYKSESLAICLSDLAFFFAFELGSSFPNIAPLVTEVTTRTGLGQMVDVHPASFTEKDMLHVYEAKTAYYTFYLPFGLASLVSTGKIDEKWLALSKDLGILYQITDDLLGYEGDEKKTGKPIDSDLREAKHTVYMSYLFSVADANDLQKLEKIYSKPVCDDDITLIHSLVSKYNVREHLESVMKERKKKINGLLSAMKLSTEAEQYLLKLTDYIISRCS